MRRNYFCKHVNYMKEKKFFKSEIKYEDQKQQDS